MSTVNSIALELIREQGDATDDLNYVALVESFVNNALDEIAVATNWNSFRARNTFDTVAAQAQYDMPQGAREIIQLRYTDTGEPITLMTIQEAARRGIKLEDSGRARAWLEDGLVESGGAFVYRIRLAPVPDSVLAIEREYYYHPSDVASGSQLPVQDNIGVAVKHRTRVFLLERDQKYDAADRARTSYRDSLASLVGQENRKVARMTHMQASDIGRDGRRAQAIFDPSHFNNPWI